MAQDISFLKSELTAEKQRITDLEAANNRRVAFSAACVEGEHIPASGSAIINLNVVITNVGNAYNPHTGVFTAPYDGYYYFIVNIDVSPDYEVIDVKRNDNPIFAADKDDKVRTHVSGSAITRLDAGDAVALHHKSRDVGYVECGIDSTFTGFLIW
nr:hypothetical protein BaRGS_025648 [Batillaria attramentaria]